MACVGGDCPQIIKTNYCTYPPPYDQENMEIKLPNSCVWWRNDVPDFTTYYDNLTRDICQNIGSGDGKDGLFEWNNSGGLDGAWSHDRSSNPETCWSCWPSKCYENSGWPCQPFSGTSFFEDCTYYWPRDPTPYDPTTKSGNSVSIFCRRQAILGNEIACCLQNFFCDMDGVNIEDPIAREQNRYNPRCFDTNSLTAPSRTCPFAYRRLGGTSCYQKLISWCSVDSAEGTIGEKWSGNVRLTNGYVAASPCLKFFFSTMYSSLNTAAPEVANPLPGGECYSDFLDYLSDDPSFVIPEANTVNARNAQNILETAVNGYLNGGGNIAAGEGVPNSDYSFNEMLRQLCTNYPGMCQNFLTSYCQQFTGEDILKNPQLNIYCGCYMSDAVYSLYTDTFQINRECTPYCNVPGTIPVPASLTNIGGLRCNQTTCIINDVSLNFVNSEVGSQGVTIGNFCSSCNASGSGVCNCVLQDLTFVSVNSEISSLNLSQSCTSAACFVAETQPDGSVIQRSIPCETDAANISQLTQRTTQEKTEIILNGVVMVLLLGLVFVLIYVFYMILSPNTSIKGNPKLKLQKSPNYMPARSYNSILNYWETK